MSTKVTLSSSFSPVKKSGTVTAGAELLDPAGARVILGWSADELVAAIAPSETKLFGPRGVCLHPNGSFWIADTGHHRLLGWHKVPEHDNQPADILIGQPDFSREGRNGKSTPSASTCNVPTGIAAWGEGLALADPWNHRVLLWRTLPTEHNQPADIILGQSNDNSVLLNRGADIPTAETLYWPYGVSVVDDTLAVCDTGNRRVLLWKDPQQTGQPADVVLGQFGFDSRDENAGDAVSAMSMRWPHQALGWQGRLAVADAGNNRVMFWNSMPTEMGQACDTVLGQSEMHDCDHNMGGYYPTASALNMPYALADVNGNLLVADTANSRLVAFDNADMAAKANYLVAQSDFASKGDNRWLLPSRDSVCWPYGMSAFGNTVAIADSGNNRVLIWDGIQ